MSKELTPIQELRSYLDLKITKMINENAEINNKLIQLLEEVDNECIRLIPKEKQGFEDAFNHGWENHDGMKFDSGGTYYNTKYNNYEI